MGSGSRRLAQLLDQLPADVTSRILSYMSFGERVTMSHVSREWRAAALSRSALWSTIPPVDDPEVLETLLLRVEDSLVSVEKLALREHTIDNFAVILSRHMGHLRSLGIQLRGMRGAGEDNLDVYASLLDALSSPAPDLREFALVDIDETLAIPHPLFGGHAPRLRTLALHCAWPGGDISPLAALTAVDDLSIGPVSRYGDWDSHASSQARVRLYLEPILGRIPSIWPHLRRLRIDASDVSAFVGLRQAGTLPLPSLADLTLQSASPQVMLHQLLRAFSHQSIYRISLWPYVGPGALKEMVDLITTAQRIDRRSDRPECRPYRLDLHLRRYGYAEARVVDPDWSSRLYYLLAKPDIFERLSRSVFEHISELNLRGLHELSKSALGGTDRIKLSKLRKLTLILEPSLTVHTFIDRGDEAPVLRVPDLQTLCIVHNQLPDDELEAPPVRGEAIEDEDEDDQSIRELPPALDVLKPFLLRKIRWHNGPPALDEPARKLDRLELRGIDVLDVSPLYALAWKLVLAPQDHVVPDETAFPFDGTVPGWVNPCEGLYT
ncbi:hypothetical protein BKA62DRAFT_490866 [Auriculariales sp. MPI-PUGE-AT-0066]|nr:hypothetical protein BKA62DRAFT_490866 [Auriculariales sp. MPI-PUGE-AT-0066]